MRYPIIHLPRIISDQHKLLQDICGAVVSLRKNQDRLALWTRTAQDEDLQKKIGQTFRDKLELPRSFQLKYMAHADAEASGSSFQNKTFYEA